MKIATGALLAACMALGSAQEAGAGRGKAEACVACHGPNGNSSDPAYPNLAGQTSRYLYLQLKDFKEGRRTNSEMAPFVEDLTRDEMLTLAAFFAAQTPATVAFQPDAAKVARGKVKAAEALCSMCHLGGFKGQNEMPRLVGQHYQYLVKQMRDFRDRKRTNDAGNMTSVSRTLSDGDIEDLSHYLASLY